MTVLEPIAEQSAVLGAVSRLLEHGPVELASAEGEHIDLPAPLQEMLRTVVRLMQAGQAVTLYPAVADPKAIERLQALDELAREAHALGLYHRNVPFDEE